MSEFNWNEFENTNFSEFERFFRDSNIQPIYDTRSDYTTNAPSFYEYLARHNHLIKILSKRIYDYDKILAKQFDEWVKEFNTIFDDWENEINSRFDEWDNLIKKFPDNVEKLLIEWLENGVINDLIINEVFPEFEERLKKLEKKNIINLLDYEHLVVDDNWSDAIHTALMDIDSVSDSLYIPYGIFELSETITIDKKIKIIGSGTIKFTGDSQYMIILNGDNSSIEKGVTLDGNNMAGRGIKSSGNNIFLDCTVINTNGYGIDIFGDFNHIGSNIDTHNNGYAGIRLFASERRIEYFSMDNVVIKDNVQKGFVVNGTMGIGTIKINSYTAILHSKERASNGFLIDTDEDNTNINVDNVIIGNMYLYGGESGTIKIENTDNFSVDTLVIRNRHSEYSNKYGGILRAKKINIGHIDTDNRISIYEQTNSLNIGYFKYTKTIDDPSHIIELRGENILCNINTFDVIDYQNESGSIRNENKGDSFIKIGTARTSKRLIAEFNQDNKVIAQSSVDKLIGGGVVTSSSINTSRVLREPRQFIANSVPSFGVWNRGDIVYRDKPSANQSLGWVCTETGDASLGTAIFNEFGTIKGV